MLWMSEIERFAGEELFWKMCLFGDHVDLKTGHWTIIDDKNMWSEDVWIPEMELDERAANGIYGLPQI